MGVRPTQLTDTGRGPNLLLTLALFFWVDLILKMKWTSEN